MPLTLVLGPANAAKAGEVLGAYTAAAHRGALLVVPTAADAEHYGREVAEQGAVLGSVTTFSGLAGEIASRAGYRSARISALGRERLMARVVSRVELDALRDSAGSRGFVVAAAALVSELERALITPQRLASALRRWAAEDPRREPYAHDVSLLYGEYARELERIGRVDRDLFAWRALDALRADPRRWGATPVFFYGFDDLDAIERDAVETLARIADAEVTVSLTYEPGRAAFAARAEAVEELRPLATRVLELPALDEHYAPGSRAALHNLERFLFEADGERVEPGGAVRLLEAGGARAEAELIAAEVLTLLRGGVAAESIVVMCRSLAAAAPVIERVFAQYGIAIAVQRRLLFAHTAVGRGLLGLARCAWLDGAPASELLAYLRSPGVVERPELADALERKIRRDGTMSAEAARAALGWELGEIDTMRDAEDPSQTLARQARRLLAAPFRRQAAILDDAEQDARAVAELLRALEEIAELGERPLRNELIELMQELEVHAGTPPRPGAVLVADPLSVRARRFRVVFVCGLQEGAFPLPGTPEPFLPDERRRELAAVAGLRLSPSEDVLARERYLFYACVSRATEQLILSYRSSDEEGNIELRSPFIADVEDLLEVGWAEKRRKRMLADVVWAAAEAPTERELTRARAAAAAAISGEPAAPDRVIGAVALERVRHSEVVSGGALETYADCPVKWLVERELAPDRFEREPDPLARGSYMHAALEQVLARLGSSVTAQTLPRALEILHEVLDELPNTLAAGRSDAVREGIQRAIEADLRRYLAHEAADACGWPPQALELRFGFDEGEEGSLPAVSLADGTKLRGVIDRVDVDPSGSGRAIVRDYKSGSARPEHQGARWETDRRLQVALYMIAVRRLLGLEPVAGLYQPLGGGDLRARGVFLKETPVGARTVGNDGRTAEELEEVLRDAEQRAVALAARLRSGEVKPCPQTCSRDGCSYPGICRSQ
jgi:ATP-dependent helicase/DNAse subunit B